MCTIQKTVSISKLPQEVEAALGYSTSVKYLAIEDEDNFVDDEICVLDIKTLKPQEGKLPIEKAFKETMEQFTFKKHPEVLDFYCHQQNFFMHFFPELFWLVQLHMYIPDDQVEIEKFSKMF